MPLSLDDYKDRIVIGVGSFMFAWMLFLTSLTSKIPNKQEVLEMIINQSPYTIDKPANTVIVNQLLKEAANNTAQLQSVKDDMFSIKLELERVLTLIGMSDVEIKKKREEANEYAP